MEQWEALIEACPTPPDLRYFRKAIQTAAVVLKEDLAPFEIEWILHTLLYKPTDLILTVCSQRTDDAWSKAIADAFKLLGETAESHNDAMEPYFEDIVTICLLYFEDAQTRIQALQCLTHIARVSIYGAKDVSRHVDNLKHSTTGRTPLAKLIGTICEHHPQAVENEINTIWRTYLNLLDSNKNTISITCSLLQGILGLFKHFGCDLPMAELNGFYDKLVGDYISISRCEEVCLRILSEHSNLFRERISRDVRLRNYVWNHLHNSSGTSRVGMQAAVAVYKSACACLAKEQIQRIATTELLPQTESRRTQVKYTALRILTFIQTTCSISIEIDGQTDVQTLEFELRNENVSYDVAEAVAWCIESKVPNSENLLQTAILFYQHLPSSRRKEIVVHNILKATDELRSAAIKFLISECTQNAECLETHQPLWKDLFDTNSGKDYVVVDKSKYVFEEFMSYTVFVLEAFLEEGNEKPSEKLTCLLQLTTQILSYQSQEEYTNDYCTILLPLLTGLLKLHPDAVIMSAATSACAHITDPTENLDLLREFYQVIDVERCTDEALLCECCLALLQLPVADTSSVLNALQITFLRNDVEPKILSKGLEKLENIIVNSRIMEGVEAGIKETTVLEIIELVEKLHSRKDMSSKDARMLHRDVLMFLGKYRNKAEVNNNSVENTVVVKLMDSLTLSIANPDEGTNYKINLQSILQQALEHEDPNSLQTLLVVICANLATKKDANLQRVLARVCVSLSRSHARGAAIDARALQAAIGLCDTAACVQYISSEKSPGVRKMVSDGLEAVLAEERGDEVIGAVAEQASLMMTSVESKTKKAGLNITETLISSLKENNLLTKNLLPDLLVLVAKTYEIDSEVTFEIASKLFLDKIELFEQEEIQKLLKTLLEALLLKSVKRNVAQINKMAENKMSELEVKIFKNTTKAVLEFMKNVFDYKEEDKNKILEIVLEIYERDDCDIRKYLYVLAKTRQVFDVNSRAFDRFYRLEICMEEPYFYIEAALFYLQEYYDMLLELYYQETVQFLGKIITDLTAQCIKYLHRQIISCLSLYSMKKIPTTLQTSFEDWCSELPTTEITNSIDKNIFSADHSVLVNSLKIMLNIFNTDSLTDLAIEAQRWSKILLKLFSSGYINQYLKSKMSYLTDILTVSVKFLKVTDMKKLILEGSNLAGLPSENVGIKFCRFFMHVFYDVLVKTPHVLLDEDMSSCCILLNDIVKYTLKKKCTNEQYDTVLELVVRLWPTYEVKATFNQKHSLLLDLNNLPRKLSLESNPLQWAINNIIYSETGREDKARLIGVLPGGNECSQAYRAFASTLPARLSEMKGGSNASFRAVLDALASTRDQALLDIVLALAGGDDTEGWWDSALDSCMASIAADGDEALCKAVYARCWDGLSSGVCRRVLLPLLRYSTSSFNEQFFSTVLEDLLEVKVNVKNAKSNHYRHHKSIVDCTRSLTILQVAFEKIPPSALESPNSALYSKMKPTQSWYIIRRACSVCVNFLTDKLKLPENADEKMKEDYRIFQCASYNCFAAAICRRRPEENWYKKLFDTQFWDKLVDSNKEYSIPIRHQWNQRTRLQPISIDMPTSAVSLTRTVGTVRTRMFLRTLSENPLMYDLVEDQVEQIETQDIRLPSNGLNSHACAGTLTALICHMTSLGHTNWPVWLTDGLVGVSRNTKWLLAQAICNCKEELKPHASVFRPALLEVVATTAIEVNGKKILNGLHVDILETLIHWGDDSPAHSANLNTALELLLTTALEHRRQVALFRAVQDVLTKLLDIYARVVTVELSVFEPYLNDSDASNTIKVLERVCKSKVHIESLLPTLTSKLQQKQSYQPSVLAKLVGLALSACRDRQKYLVTFRKVLDQVRQNSATEYIKMLYYAQSECAECCDEYNFRMTTNLTQKLVGPEKLKCLQILTSFVATSSSEYIQEMFETIDLPDLILQENVDAFKLVMQGVKIMSESVKKRMVMLVAKYCGHSSVKVRSVAVEVILKAFEDLFTRTSEPVSKKPKLSTTPIISKILSNDVYSTTVLSCLASGLIDKDGGISKMAREGVAKMLPKDMGARLASCFYLAVYLPAVSPSSAQEVSACSHALLELLLSDLRTQERFKRIRLRDDPVEFKIKSSSSSKLLTMSRTYQGSFRRRTNLTSRHSLPTPDLNTNKADIDVQVPIERILDTFMEFSKSTPAASQALCLQLIQAIKPSFDLGPEVGSGLAAILDRGVNELTPFVVELCRSFIDDVCKVQGFLQTVEKLRQRTMNTEGQTITDLLYQEVVLRCRGYEQFVLGSFDQSYDDVAMAEDVEFSIQDLTSAFGKLSNWDSLSVDEKNRVRSSGLPPLWTDNQRFVEQLEYYTSSVSWLDKMVSAYNRQHKEDVMKWLREMDKWPRRHFHISAITEAIEWQNRCKESNLFPCDIQPADCLAEWAARFMIRTAYQASVADSDKESSIKTFRRDELLWCEEANRRELGPSVLECVKRNTHDLCNGEALSWLTQKVSAQRCIGLQNNNDIEMLKLALDTAETYTPQFAELSDGDTVVQMNKLIVLLNKDLDCLTKEKLADILDLNDKIIHSNNNLNINKKNLHAMYELAMTYYDDLWENETDTNVVKTSLLSDMLDILKRCSNLGLFDEGLLALILNKLNNFDGKTLSEDVMKKLLDQVQLNLPSIDDFALQLLLSHSRLFPSRSLSAFPFMCARDDDVIVKYKRCFELICDAEYSLRQYCSELRHAIKKRDEDQWEEVFKRMKRKLFENPYSGSDYQLLNRYKSKLFEISEYDMSSAFESKADKVLKEMGRLLSQRGPQNGLRLSQLCPALSHCEDVPRKLLGLRDNVTVVRIDEQVAVLNSIRRPTVFKVLLSDGTTRRYLHKSGEPLKVDAAAQNVLTYAAKLWRGVKCPVVVYNVTPLSEDCGLIEFLEDHETLRRLIGGPEVLDAALDTVLRPADHELILSPMPANLSQHNQLSDRIPSYLLRDAILKRSACEQDRSYKMKSYQDTLASTTILTWILGIGDRHLENVLYSIQDGRLCHIDWGAIFKYGGNEMPPARLTRNVLAVCDNKVLEARLQQLLTSLRESSKLFLAVAKTSFEWMENGFHEKYRYMESILQGTALSYNVTRQVLEDSKMNKHIELLDNVFQDVELKDKYRVDEQISCLLRHCTDPQILSVTRSGWEPWV